MALRDPRRVFKADKTVYPAGHLTCGLDPENRDIVAEYHFRPSSDSSMFSIRRVFEIGVGENSVFLLDGTQVEQFARAVLEPYFDRVC